MHLTSASRTMSAPAAVTRRFVAPKCSWMLSGRLAPRTSANLSSSSTQQHRLACSSGQKLHLDRSHQLHRSLHVNPRSVINLPIAIGNRRDFSAAAPKLRDHHFDTLKFVQRLKDEGISEEQAVALMKVLSDVIEERLVISSLSAPTRVQR